MEGRPPPDLEPQNQQEEEEVVVFLLQNILIITQLKLKVLCFFSRVSFNESRESDCVKPVSNSRVPFFPGGGTSQQETLK